MRKPFFNQRRHCWFVWSNGKQVRLDPDNGKALAMWRDMMTPTNDVRVAKVVERFLARPRKAATQKFYESHLKLFLDEAGHLRVKDLRVHHLTDLLDQYEGGAYKRNIGRCVKCCFKWAAEGGRIDSSPFANFKLPPAVSRGDDAYLDEDQVATILQRAAGDLKEILTFLAKTGARPKEARILRAEHLHGQIAIYSREETKGKRDRRVIHLNDGVFALVQRLRLKRPTGPLFLNGDKPWTAKALAERCKGLSERLRIEFSAYSLRHSYISNAIIRGVDLKSLADLVGHKDLRMISTVYSHLQKCGSHLQEAAQRATA